MRVWPQPPVSVWICATLPIVRVLASTQPVFVAAMSMPDEDAALRVFRACPTSTKDEALSTHEEECLATRAAGPREA